MEYIVTYVEKTREVIPPRKPVYKQFWYGPKGRKWPMKILMNDPGTSKIRIFGKRYVNGEYSNDYVQYL
jgi:hypothetical protein